MEARDDFPADYKGICWWYRIAFPLPGQYARTPDNFGQEFEEVGSHIPPRSKTAQKHSRIEDHAHSII